MGGMGGDTIFFEASNLTRDPPSFFLILAPGIKTHG
jgi:hypothetical protein